MSAWLVLTYFAVVYGVAFACVTHALRHVTQKMRRAAALRLAELEEASHV